MPNQATGALSKVVMGIESAFKTAPSAGFSMPFNTSGIKSTRNRTAAKTIRGNYNPAEPFNGNLSVGGNVEIPMDSLALWYWLQMMFGNPVTTGTGPYVHKFKVGLTRPSFTIEHQYLDLAVPAYFRYLGCKASSFNIQTGGDGELVGTVGVVGAGRSIETTPFAASPGNPGFVRLENFHATIKEGGALHGSIKSMDLSVNFNPDTSQYVIGSGGTLGSIPNGVMGISGTVTALFDSVSLLEKALNSTESSLELILTGSASSSLSLLLPEIKYGEDFPTIDGPQGIMAKLPFEAYFKDATEASSIVATLTNTAEHS